ncbi:MAG: CZB domain-containing protein [Sulfurimonas sp.]|nr:CZB domain-containing protein [Sulfurimonas sp.]
MSDYLYTTLVKVDHIIFKHDVYTAILGQDIQAASLIQTHTECRLGKWYTDQGKELFGKTSAYMAINAPHTTIHTDSLTALQNIEEANYIPKYKDSLIKKMSNVESESFKLFDLLKDMVAQANPKLKF